MDDRERQATIEQKRAVIDAWIDTLSETGKIPDIEPQLLKEVLASYGADFEVLQNQELRNIIGAYSNARRAQAMTAIWGNKFGAYKDWAKGFAADYQRTHPELGGLPKLERSGSKTSGMIQFFGELTAYASGQLSDADFRRYVEARIFNGQKWAEGKKDERIKIVVSGETEPVRPSSIPPGFPKEAWEQIIK